MFSRRAQRYDCPVGGASAHEFNQTSTVSLILFGGLAIMAKSTSRTRRPAAQAEPEVQESSQPAATAVESTPAPTRKQAASTDGNRVEPARKETHREPRAEVREPREEPRPERESRDRDNRDRENR